MKRPGRFEPNIPHLTPSRSSIHDSAVRVSLPVLIGLNQATARLRLHPGPIRARQSGGYLSKFKGRGMEFDEVRPYIPGDDVRSLDWRVTARTGRAHTKLFREERERPVFIVVDYSPTMFFATRGVFKSVLAAQLAALVAWSANRHGDRVGGMVFTGTTRCDIQPQNGKQPVLSLLKTLADWSIPARSDHPEVERADANMEAALVRLGRHARPGSLVVIASDFRTLDRSWESHFMRLSRHCDVMLLSIYDTLERELPPPGHYRLSNGRQERTIDTTDHQYRHTFQRHFQQRQEHLRRIGLKYGMRMIPCETRDDPVRVLQAGW